MRYFVSEPKDDAGYTVKSGDTLESIVTAECEGIDDWKALARFNWGTDLTPEVVRALTEIVGLKVSDLSVPSLPLQEVRLRPDGDLPHKLRLPKIWKKDKLKIDKKHKITLKKVKPCNAVSILKLDKWFIPETENCHIEYDVEGEKTRAQNLRIEIFGSNYTECTDWNKGLGTYDKPENFVDEALYSHHESDVKERKSEVLEWAGDVTTDKGLLGRKTGKAKKRYINVAFSPYTGHFRHYKSNSDKDARVLLDSFWLKFDEKKTEPAAVADFTATPATVQWTNAADQDFGTLEILDKTGQRVHLEVLEDDQLEAGEGKTTWDKQYRKDALNGEFEAEFIDDSAKPDPPKDLLFKSMPYKAKVKTFKYKSNADSLKIKWEVKNTTKLERGCLRITDGKGKLVFLKGLPKAKLAQGKHELAWDGKYPTDVKNSKDGDEAIPADMPYRVQIQANVGVDKDEGLALAAMHTEVRLYVHKDVHRPKDPRFDPWKAEPSLELAKAPFVPGDPPKQGERKKWFRHNLAELGFHPGPVTDAGASDDVFKIALREFKRSVPADCSATAPNFKRQNLDGTEDEATNIEAETAIRKMTDAYKRKPFGDPTRVNANSEQPDLSDDEVKANLPDREKEVIVWVDDRQYTTDEAAKNESGDPFLSGERERVSFGLKNYRGKMDIADNRVGVDEDAISRPWIPLRADLRLMSRKDELDVEYSKATVFVDDKDKGKKEKLDAARRAMGPLRVDWTFDELPPDISTIKEARYDEDFSRSRKYVAWAMRKHRNQAAHKRKDTDRDTTYTNCKEDLGGIRPDDGGLTGYYKKAFGAGDLSLAPWQGVEDGETESIATVVHDHIAKAQKEKTDLFPSHVGLAGVYFNPSRTAGDGYRVRAQVNFKKCTGYDFPNLKVLEARYAATPQAHSARLRLWRRSSIRGYMCWGTATAGHWPNYLASFRDFYKAGHVYYVHEATNAPRTLNVASVFTPGTDDDLYKNIIHHNSDDVDVKKKNRMQLRSADIWPWGHRDDLGWPWRSEEGIPKARLYKDWLNGIISMTWRDFREGLLLALLRQVEKNGVMRGHLFVEFDASPAMRLTKYRCGNGHTYWWILKDGVAAPNTKGNCPTGGCPRTCRKTADTKLYDDGMPLPAVGVALGATWLFTDPSNPDTWAHEVGHHRHLEHAASAPGAQYDPPGDPTDPPANADLHDSERNTTVANWATHTTDPAEQRWDRQCIMSYEDPPDLYFCGKCLLRNRGWKVQGLGYPGTDIVEP